MKIYVWRHNKKFHSYSMIEEPCANSQFYQDAIAIVAAENKDQAIRLLLHREDGWRAEDLERLEAKEYSLEEAKVLFTLLQ